jgi:hypothetical protein
MKVTEGMNSTECREVIRQRAFELADSGIFDDWEAIRRALCSRFHVAHLHQIFSSPFCRMDIDQRCRTARTSSSLDSATPVANDNRESVKPHLADRAIPASSPPMASCGRRRHLAPARRIESQGLVGAIAALLDDGRELTAIQVAEELGAARREVQRAFREMLADDKVHVARRAPRSICGRPVRIFASGPITGGDAATSATSCWPGVDPVVLRVMDALARHG